VLHRIDIDIAIFFEKSIVIDRSRLWRNRNVTCYRHIGPTTVGLTAFSFVGILVMKKTEKNRNLITALKTEPAVAKTEPLQPYLILSITS